MSCYVLEGGVGGWVPWVLILADRVQFLKTCDRGLFIGVYGFLFTDLKVFGAFGGFFGVP